MTTVGSSNSPSLGDEDAAIAATIKGRLRKPSAKALAAADSAVGVTVSTPREVSRVAPQPSRTQKSILSLQYAVAETVVNDEEEIDESSAARKEAVTIEMISANEWKGRKRNVVKRQQPIINTSHEMKLSDSENRGANVMSPTGGEITTDASPSLVAHNADELIGDSNSEDSARLLMEDKQQPEVKRKRGRPFKGQEKPIEERLMVETSKIRRLIDDVIRKGGDGEFFVRLRKIASDLDDVLQIMPNSGDSGIIISASSSVHPDEAIIDIPLSAVVDRVDEDENMPVD